jgi:hypothetical protein
VIAFGDERIGAVADDREGLSLQVERVQVARTGDRRGRDSGHGALQEDERDVLVPWAQAGVLRVAEARPRQEPGRVDDDVVGHVVGRARVGRRVERDAQIVRPEAVRAFLDQEVGAVGGGEDDVRRDERPRAEVEPVRADLELEHADVLERVIEVGRAADDGACRGRDQQDGRDGHGDDARGEA